VGQPRDFPPLGPTAMLQQADPIGLDHLILAGARIGASPTRLSPMTMPSFAWKLTDQEIADVSTFISHSWGNQTASVSAAEVHNTIESTSCLEDLTAINASLARTYQPRCRKHLEISRCHRTLL
jgi:hypothetical protein